MNALPHNYNRDENVLLVNNTTFDTRTVAGSYESIKESILNDSPLDEALADLFTLEVYQRPSGSRYGILKFA
jgi:hypothetical protein